MSKQKQQGRQPEEPRYAAVSGVRGKFAPGLIEAWGESALAEVVRCIDDPFHDEMTEVVFESGLSPAEQTLYLEASSEVHTLRAKLIRLEEQVLEALLPKLEKRLKRLIASGGQADFKVKLHDFLILFDYPNMLRQFLTPGTNVRNMRVMELMTGIMMRMVCHVQLQMIEKNVPRGIQDHVMGILKGLFDELTKTNKLNYLAFNLLGFLHKDSMALQKSEEARPGTLDHVLSAAPDLTNDELDMVILEVDDLLSARRKSFNTSGISNGIAMTPVLESESIARAKEVAKIALILNPDQPYRAPIQLANGFSSYSPNEGALEFTADRSLNELCIPQTHFSMKLLFESNPKTKPRAEELYRKLKALVYTNLRDYLRDLPEDPRPEPQKGPLEVIEDVHKEVERVELEEQPSVPAYVPYVKPLAPEEPSVPSEEPQVPRLRFDECTGFSGNEVLRLLNSLLGEAERIRGSHHLFRSPNGTLLPVPLHGADKVNPRILRDCIEAWGLTVAWRRILRRD